MLTLEVELLMRNIIYLHSLLQYIRGVKIVDIFTLYQLFVLLQVQFNWTVEWKRRRLQFRGSFAGATHRQKSNTKQVKKFGSMG